jgi:hypothetical protein
MTSPLDSIISKINKLRSLATSSNINEANAATAAANKLIDSYRLSEADLTEETDGLTFDETYIYETGKVTAWKNHLIHILAKHYGLAVLNDAHRPGGRQVSRFKLIGRKSDIEIGRYMFAWLTSECTRLAEPMKGSGRVAIASYCLGFVYGVGEQLEASRKQVVAENHSTGLVKLEARQAEAKKFMHDSIDGLRTVKSKSAARHDHHAFSSGKSAGASMHLGSALPGKTKLLGQS